MVVMLILSWWLPWCSRMVDRWLQCLVAAIACVCVCFKVVIRWLIWCCERLLGGWYDVLGCLLRHSVWLLGCLGWFLVQLC